MLEVLVLVVCILICSTSSVNGATDPTQASALRVMYTSLNSSPQLTGWSSTGDDPCGQSWKGVTCSGSSVTEIKLSSLQLSGSMGYQLDSLTALTNFDMSNNNLGNSIPYQLPPNLQRLNLAGNSFNGGLPYSISQMTSLKYLNVSRNQLQGELGGQFGGQLTGLSTLDLSFNTFTGNLPQGFSSLSSINSMFLQNNQFTGPIDVLADLPLQNLNVGNNHFTGWIPPQLRKLNNNLQIDGNSWTNGPAPPPPPFTPPPTNRRTNPGQRSGGNNSPSDNGGGGKKSGIGGGGVAGIVISVLVVGAIVAFFLVKRKSKSSLDEEKLTYDRPFTPLASNEVKEMKSVQTSSAANTKILETSLSINLKPPPIDRHKSFDEDEFSNKPIVKRTNTATINATIFSVADLQMATGSFSVENLIGEGSMGRVYRGQFDDGKASNQNTGSGYTAPEVVMSGQYTLKSDVYSFGVVMLELLTGRKPFDSSRPRSEQSLVRWATPQLHDIDALAKMVDPSLKGLYPAKSLSRFADVVALCVQPEPEFRPPMSEVVQALVRLVQRANMSKRTTGGEEQRSTPRADDSDIQEYML